MLEFLQDISPWWWVAFGLALGALEMATMSFFLIWPAIAALLSAGLVGMQPQISGPIQVATFAVLSVALTFAGRYILNRFGDGGEVAETLNSRAQLMAGRHAEVLTFTGPEGRVKIDSVQWRARWPKDQSATPGETVRVEKADGMTLLISASK